jgi:hypothetical protein
MTELDTLVERLELAAAELRSGELEPAQAADLVEDVARLASEASAALDRAVRAEDASSQGQLELG